MPIDMTGKLPVETELTSGLDTEFNRLFDQALDNAKISFQLRGVELDAVTPFWQKQAFGEVSLISTLHEDVSRLVAAVHSGDPTNLEKIMNDKLLDIMVHTATCWALQQLRHVCGQVTKTYEKSEEPASEESAPGVAVINQPAEAEPEPPKRTGLLHRRA